MRSLRRAQVVFPVSAFPAAPSQSLQPESILGPLLPARPPASALDPRFAASGLFNGPVYALHRLRLRPQLSLHCRAARYFDSLNTSESRELDLRAGLPCLPVRNPLLGGRRTAAIGIATLVALRSGPRHHLLLGRVAAKAMPHHAGQLHVVPSGMFAPPYSIAANVANELREELGLSLSAGRLYLSGAALNHLNLRPEICTLFVLDDPGPLSLNAEFLPGLLRIPLSSDAQLVRALKLTAPSITPPGAAALFLGARLLRSLIRA
ncbi:MAG: hypothetical protein HY821_05035 [Acidobacteria bacterium]|nr:hypothetical protein [Acidobacteriota bacterium]